MKKSTQWGLVLLVFAMVALPIFATTTTTSYTPASTSNTDSEREITLVKVGEDVVVPAGMEVDNAISIGGNVIVNGIVRQSAVSVGGSVRVQDQGRIYHGVSIGKYVYLQDKSEAKGDVLSIGGDVIQGAESTLHGFRKVVSAKDCVFCIKKEAWTNEWPLAMKLIVMVGVLTLSLILVAFLPRWITNVAMTIKGSPWASLGWGVLAVVLFLPVILLLILSLVGMILVPILMIFYWISVLVGFTSVGALLGEKILGDKVKKSYIPIFQTLLGVVLLLALGFIPVVHWIVKGIVSVVGLGAVLMTLVTYTHRKSKSA